MKQGLLRSLKQRIGQTSLYLVSVKGLDILKTNHLISDLSYIKTVDWKSSKHDLAIADVRLIFEKAGFEWTTGRILRIGHPRKKVSDGRAKYKDHIFSVEIEKEGHRHNSYNWIFTKRCRERSENIILYIVKDEKTKLKRIKDAFQFNRIYFASMDELLERKSECEFTNSLDEELILEDLIHPETCRALDRSLDLFRISEREYRSQSNPGLIKNKNRDRFKK